jgi:hypothetical protein
MFVIDPDTFLALCNKNFAAKAVGVEVVDLLTGNSFVCA